MPDHAVREVGRRSGTRTRLKGVSHRIHSRVSRGAHFGQAPPTPTNSSPQSRHTRTGNAIVRDGAGEGDGHGIIDCARQ